MARGHVGQDLVGLMELYAEESVLESSAILVLEKNTLGILGENLRLGCISSHCFECWERAFAVGVVLVRFV